MAYPWATPAPTYSSAPGVSTGTPGVTWNQAWNMGYNNSTGANPYSGDIGSGYSAGQQQYLADYARTHQSTPPPSGGGTPPPSGQVLGTQTPPSDGGQTDPYASVRSDISSGWDQYMGSLDEQLTGLTGQRANQEGMVNSQQNQAVNTLDLNKGQAITQLGNETTQTNQNQVKTMADLSNNIRNSMMAGNVYLGARGAGDSSAANQYAYALTKMGTQQRSGIANNTSNILADIQGRVDNVTNIYNTEKKNLQEGVNQQIMKIAEWFGNAQMTIQQQKAQGALGKSQDLASLSKDILNQGLAAIQTAQQQMVNRQAALDSWAATNSKNLSELQTNMKNVSSPSYNLPQATGFGGPTMTANGALSLATPAVGYGSTTLNDQTKTYPFASTLRYQG
jgi:hypothetical protein